jgi:DNA-binding transcriptional regulator YiaG
MSADLAGTKEETSRILGAVHETARDLHTAGVISKRRMKEYDSLCLVSVRLSSIYPLRPDPGK